MSADDDNLNIDQLKALTIGAVTSALNARAQEDPQDRIEQFASDYKMLLEGITMTDLYRLASLLADLSSSMVQQIAALLGTSQDNAMQYIAQEMLGASVTEVEE